MISKLFLNLCRTESEYAFCGHMHDEQISYDRIINIQQIEIHKTLILIVESCSIS